MAHLQKHGKMYSLKVHNAFYNNLMTLVIRCGQNCIHVCREPTVKLLFISGF